MLRCARVNHIGMYLALLHLCAFTGVGTALAQNTHELPVEDVVNMQFFRGDLREFSADGKWLAFSAGPHSTPLPGGDVRNSFIRTGLPSDSNADIFVVNVRTREQKNLTEGKGNNWLPAWSPNSHYLAFISNRGGEGRAELWVWDAQRDHLRKVSAAALRMRGPQQIAWTPDSRKLVVVTVPKKNSTPAPTEITRFDDSQDKTDEKGSSGPNVVVYKGSPVVRDGQVVDKSDPWGLEDTSGDLVLIDLSTGQATTLTQEKRIACFRVSGDGLRVGYSTSERFEKPGSQQILYNLAVIDLARSSDRVVATGIRLGFVGEFSFSPSGTKLCYRAAGQAEREFDIYTVDLDGGSARNVTAANVRPKVQFESSGWTFSKPLWHPSGESVYYVSQGDLWTTSVESGATRKVAHLDDRYIRDLIGLPGDRIWTEDEGRSTVVITHNTFTKQDGFYKIELANGTATKLMEKGECYTCEAGVGQRLAAASNDGQMIAFTAEDSRHPADLWLSDIDFRNPVRLTNLNPKLDKYKMGASRLVEWMDDDGERRHGTLTLPSEYQIGKASPLVVRIYGGGMPSEKLEMFGGPERGVGYLNTQLLATRGYALLMPDAPQHLGTPMLDLAKTTLSGVNRLIEMGIVDPQRVAVMGQSYGGYSTLSLLVQTARFKAAVESDGPSDLIAFYGEMFVDGTSFGSSIGETGQGLMGGTPWQYRERYIENSPFFYLDRIETPLLIMHGAQDGVIAPFLGDEIFVGLRRLGKIVEYAKYQGEGHVFTGYANQVDAANRVILWFDKYLKQEGTNKVAYEVILPQ
jgi:dipeptidyl aminopeptidase/acylaminoacyl peptidase